MCNLVLLYTLERQDDDDNLLLLIIEVCVYICVYVCVRALVLYYTCRDQREIKSLLPPAEPSHSPSLEK